LETMLRELYEADIGLHGGSSWVTVKGKL